MIYNCKVCEVCKRTNGYCVECEPYVISLEQQKIKGEANE